MKVWARLPDAGLRHCLNSCPGGAAISDLNLQLLKAPSPFPTA